jgi:hypothetical protein
MRATDQMGVHKAVSPAYIFKMATSYARKIERSTGQANVQLIDQLFLAVQAKAYINQHQNFQTLASKHKLHVYLLETNRRTSSITRNEGAVAKSTCAGDDAGDDAGDESRPKRAHTRVRRTLKAKTTGL